MAADDFFNRWSRKNEQARQEREQQPPPAPPPDPYEGRTPDLEDAARLTPDADFLPFMKQGVDETVKRSALRKLFADPQFNVMDGLDIYIGDYTQSDPIPPEMMAMLNLKDLFDPPGLRNASVMAMQETVPEALQEAAPGVTEALDADSEANANADANADVTANANAGESAAAADDAATAAPDTQADVAHPAEMALPVAESGAPAPVAAEPAAEASPLPALANQPAPGLPLPNHPAVQAGHDKQAAPAVHTKQSRETPSP